MKKVITGLKGIEITIFENKDGEKTYNINPNFTSIGGPQMEIIYKNEDFYIGKTDAEYYPNMENWEYKWYGYYIILGEILQEI